jgi:NAD(P)-dependent dehydrogenase (short-subunit alcohol dehydrogenase family)
LSLFSLQDRLVVVTGAAGQIGRFYTSQLLELGVKVAALDLTEKSLERLPDHPSLVKLVADVTKRASLEEALVGMRSAFGEPYGLVNNAGLDSPPGAPKSENGPYEGFPEEVFDRVMEVNVKGVHLCCQVFGGAMAQAGRGSIINIGSIYGLVSPVQDIYEFRRTEGEEYYKPIAYSVSKSALLNLSRYLATYWAAQGVRVNTLTLAGLFNGQDPRFIEAYTQRMPMKRMAKEEDYIGPLVFLLSEASQYVTGSNLVVDGGWTAW